MQRTAIILSLCIAVVASVFAIWPAVADAPWEEENHDDLTEQLQALVEDVALLKLAFPEQIQVNQTNNEHICQIAREIDDLDGILAATQITTAAPRSLAEFFGC